MKKSFEMWSIALSLLAIITTVAAGILQPAHAVFSGDMSPKARSGDADYADGIDAWDAKNWNSVVTAMRKVVARRPWHDKAWTRLGFALRKLNRLDESLEAYGKALAINPDQREALEYLGEAYLILDRLERCANDAFPAGRGMQARGSAYLLTAISGTPAENTSS